ncbi:MAG: hypothetical protein U0354_01905 [Candidatus Sericytochromatia bacterium]
MTTPIIGRNPLATSSGDGIKPTQVIKDPKVDKEAIKKVLEKPNTSISPIDKSTTCIFPKPSIEPKGIEFIDLKEIKKEQKYTSLGKTGNAKDNWDKKNPNKPYPKDHVFYVTKDGSLVSQAKVNEMAKKDPKYVEKLGLEGAEVIYAPELDAKDAGLYTRGKDNKIVLKDPFAGKDLNDIINPRPIVCPPFPNNPFTKLDEILKKIPNKDEVIKKFENAINEEEISKMIKELKSKLPKDDIEKLKQAIVEFKFKNSPLPEPILPIICPPFPDKLNEILKKLPNIDEITEKIKNAVSGSEKKLSELMNELKDKLPTDNTEKIKQFILESRLKGKEIGSPSIPPTPSVDLSELLKKIRDAKDKEEISEMIKELKSKLPKDDIDKLKQAIDEMKLKNGKFDLEPQIWH